MNHDTDFDEQVRISNEIVSELLEEERQEREFQLEYGILRPEFWRELNDWRQKALDEESP